MPLDPTVQFILSALAKQGVKSFEQMSIADARALIDTFPSLQNPPEPVAAVEELALAGVPLRVYTPERANGAAILYTHGGGWIGGNLAVCDEPARALANETGAVVVATSYRLAPEAHFPAQPDDVLAALRWLLANAARLGVDPRRIALVGDSAGGQLMAVTAIRARDADIPLAAQVLIYPVVDRRSKGASKRDYADGYLITRAAVDWFWDHYLAAPADIEHPLASPLNAKDLSGLPPALILTAEYDPARDEAIEYGEALRKAGNELRHVPLPGLIHGAFWMSGAIPRASEVLAAIGEFLGEKLGARG
ncbi:MAG TPA: alpha/beta hydrolase [Gammaproteobacteria bacterium]|nr:alpha/beta hydrolase [Gammaproteobacteria bacterium]